MIPSPDRLEQGAFMKISDTILYKNILHPPLKWAVGKRWLVPELLSLWEPYSHNRLWLSRYVEVWQLLLD